MRSRWLIVVVLAAAIGVAPFLKADRFGPRIQAALETALGRNVEIGAVRLSLLPSPGFSVRNVVIHEDPAVSPEPFAYVGNLVVSMRWWSLLQGRMEISRLRLEDPSLNLMRNAAGVWNLEGLRGKPRAGGRGDAEGGDPLPELEVRRGRVNFKLEDTKSAYYFTDTDIDFSEADGGNFEIWFVGEPARTDRQAQGFGRMTARGRLRTDSGEPRLDLEIRVEPSALEEMSALLAGYDAGVHGTVLGRAQVSGTLPRLEVSGRLELAELHHWSQPPRDGGIQVQLRGNLDVREQKMALETEAAGPFSAKFQLSRYLTAPQWELELEAKELQIAPAAAWFRPASEKFDGMKLGGTLSGQLRLRPGQPASGQGTLNGLDWSWGESNRLAGETVGLELEQGEAKLRSPALTLNGDSLQGECVWSVRGERWECKGNSRGVGVQTLKAWAAGWELPVPVVAELESGQMRGSLTARKAEGEPVEWRGAWELRNARLAAPELAEPVTIRNATVQLQPQRVVVQQMEAAVGKLEWKGSYRFEEAAARPNRLDVEFEQADLKELERLLRPALQRSRGFLARTLGIGEDRVPEWLAGRRVEARFHVGRLVAGPLQMDGVSGEARWDAERLTLAGLTGEWNGGRWEAAGTIRLRGAGPEYDLSGRLEDWSWANGSAWLEGKLRTRGLGADWLANLQAEGRAEAQGVELGGAVYESLSGRYNLDLRRQPDPLRLEELEALAGGQKLTGKASVQREGRVVAEFTGEGRELRLQANLRPFAVIVLPPTGAPAGVGGGAQKAGAGPAAPAVPKPSPF